MRKVVEWILSFSSRGFHRRKHKYFYKTVILILFITLIYITFNILASNSKQIPIIYAITPTYARPEQKPELLRLCYTFLHVHNFHWIIVEDSKKKTKLVTEILKNCNLPRMTHLNVETPMNIKLSPSEQRWRKPRGVAQRNKGLSYLRELDVPDGVVYFADDDNTYSLELFEVMRNTKTVSVWPVGLVGDLLVEKPRLDSSKNVIGWDVGWDANRPFAIDMAGFAVNISLIKKNTKALFPYKVRIGYVESEFLKHLISNLKELEPKSHNQVLVWHTRTEKTSLKYEVKRKKEGIPPSDTDFLL